MNKKIFSTTLAILMLASAPLTYNASISDYLPTQKTAEEVAPAAATDIVTFPDAEFEDALAQSQGWTVGEITVGDMESLTTLNLSSFGDITDITGIEYAVNLTSLAITDSHIRDLSPLSGLTNLTYLDLSQNQISDVSPLSEMINLTTLNLDNNQISDVSPLSEMVNLTILNLDNNQISDVSPLSEMVNLYNLYLDNNQITDISGLGNLIKLDQLYADNNQITDISALAEIDPNIIYLSNNQITDISPLEGKTPLYLRLDNNGISDLSPLAAMSNAEYTEELSVYSQRIQPADLKVTDNNEIFYNLTNITGEVVPVSLGVPTSGYSTLTAEFQMDAPIENGFIDMAAGDGFSGTITQNISFTTLTGLDNTTTTEETSLTDSELIEMFEVTSNIDSVISVDQSAVDYTTPGEYQVVFTDTDSNEFIGTLTVTDVIPTLMINNAEITLVSGSNSNDLIAALDMSATEITDGDLTASIVVDDSNVNYDVVGTYEVYVSVVDQEANIVSQTITVVIESNDTSEETGSETDSEVSTDEIDSEVSTDDNDDYKQFSLANTGSELILTIIGLVIFVLVIVGIKKVVVKK